MIATALTAEQAKLHGDNLANTTNFRVFPILAETVLYAIYTVLIVTSSYILIGRGLRSRSRQLMLAVTLTMYALASWDWAIDVHLLRDDLKVFLPADLIQPPPDNAQRVKVNAALHISQAILNNVCVMLGDMVVCWRVYAVYGRDRNILYIAIGFLSALFSALLLCNLTQIGIAFPSVGPLHRLAPGQLQIDIVTLILSALVNIWATSMIAYRAWVCRQQISGYLRGTSNRVFAESILTLFAESGAIYTALWILKNIIIIPSIEPTAYTDYASVLMYQLTGMYPTILIILVAFKNSHLETQFTSYGGATTNGGGEKIVFVNPTVTSDMDSSNVTGSNTELESKDGINGGLPDVRRASKGFEV